MLPVFFIDKIIYVPYNMNEFIHIIGGNILYLNFIFAWSSTIGLLLLFIIYPLRIYISRNDIKNRTYLLKVNKLLHKIHKTLGIIILILTFIHCRLSSQKLGVNTGTLCLILMIFILGSYLFKKQLKNKWLKIHRTLTIILLITIILHIILTRLT